MKKKAILKIAMFFILFIFSGESMAQIKIADGAKFNVYSDSYLLTNDDLIINSGGLLSLRGCATISGTLTNSAGASGLVVESDALGTGSLIESSGVSATVERFTSLGVYHYITPPVSGQSIALLQVGAAHTDFDLFWYDEDNSGGQGPLWIDASEQSGNLETGMGYAYAYMPDNRILDFQGTTHQGDITEPVTYSYNAGVSASEWYFGWNIVGNPYPSRISATEFINDDANSNIYGTLYFWDEGAAYTYGVNDYGSWNLMGATSGGGGNTPNGYIGVGQAFMVHYGSGTGTSSSNISFNNSMRVHNEAVFFKNSDPWRFKISLQHEEGAYNETLIGFVPGTTNGFDNKYDGAKLKGNPNIALYTKLLQDDGKDYAIQALPPLTPEGASVELGMNAGKEGLYTLRVVSIENFDANVPIYLQDKYQNRYINLRYEPEYHFSIEEAQTINDRFVVHFNNYGVGTEEIAAVSPYVVYTYYGEIIIESKVTASFTAIVYDVNGRQLTAEKAVNTSKLTLDIHGSTGIYLVRIIGEDFIENVKIYVR